ncbi:MAG: hypothetical protein AABY22_01770, partial [Nanoarchaeota archaeon]
DVARSNLLPENQPMVEGRPLNYSPTAQNAIVESQKMAALAPLLGLNQSITAQYGSLGDILSQAKDIYQSQIDAAKTRAEYDYKYRESNKGTGGGDFSGLLSALLQGQQGGQQQAIEDFWTDEEEAAPISNRGSVLQQVQGLPGAGFQFGLPSGFRGPEGLGARLGAWKDLIFRGLTGG